MLQLWQNRAHYQGVLCSKKRKRQPQEFRKRRRPVSRTLLPLALVQLEIDYTTKLNMSTAGRASLPHSATPSAQSIDKLRGLNTIWKSQLEISAPASNIHQVVNGLCQNNELYYHLFHDFTAYANSKVFQAQIMINLSTTWNLIL